MIYFGILVHEKIDVVESQLNNIRNFVPQSKIVLYDGSSNPKFSKQLKKLAKDKDILTCFNSRPIKYTRIARVILDITTYLEEIEENYDYFIYLDSDIMFVQHGFEEYLEQIMNGYDFMGIDTWIEHNPGDSNNKPAKMLWKEWTRWQPFFETDYFCRTLNSNQVYRHWVIKKILSNINKSKLEGLLTTTNVFALEEFLYGTLAIKNGAKRRSYPKESRAFVWLDLPLTMDEIKEASSTKDVYFVHPVKRSMKDPARLWISSKN